MKFTSIPIQGAYYIDLEKRGDDRGFFARYFCEREFLEAGLCSKFVQINNSLSEKAGTCRGLHYQLPPFSEVKVVRCIKGEILDIIVDLRPDSPSFKQWYAAELTAKNRRMFYVPEGCAHGVFSLVDDSEIIYQSSNFYNSEYERGIRVDDKAFNIQLPFPPTVISDKDCSMPDFNFEWHCVGQMGGLCIKKPYQGIYKNE